MLFRSMSALIMNLQYFFKPWKEYSYSPMKGTFASPQKARAVDIYKPLENLDYTKKTIFLCHDGIHSVAPGYFVSNDKFFVDWGPLFNNEKETSREIAAQRIVVCDRKLPEVMNIAKLSNKKLKLFQEVKNGDTYRSLGIIEKE